MNDLQILDELVPPHAEQPDWQDVLRRARVRRGPRRLTLVAAALVAAALVVGPALGVLLTRHPTAQLPAAADRNNVVVIVQPVTGRVLLQAAPWKGHRGICFVILSRHAGCAARGSNVFSRPVVGYTFDDRVVSGTATALGGKRFPLRVERFTKRHATFFYLRTRLPGFFTRATLRDAQGKVVARYRFEH